MLLQGLCILCANHYLLAYVRVMRLISFGISLDLDTVSLSSARLSLVSSGPRKLLEGLPQHHAGVLRRERERERQKVRQRERRQKEKERHIGKEREKEREGWRLCNEINSCLLLGVSSSICSSHVSYYGCFQLGMHNTYDLLFLACCFTPKILKLHFWTPTETVSLLFTGFAFVSADMMLERSRNAFAKEFVNAI